LSVKLSSFLQWKINVCLYQRLGWKLTYQYLRLLGTIYYFFNWEEKQRIERSLEQVFEGKRERSKIQELKRQVFQGILAHYYEKIFNAYEELERLRGFFEASISTGTGLVRLERGLSRGNGVLFITGHYGGIEYIPIFLALKGYPISVVAKFSTGHLKETLYMKTKDIGLRIIDAGEEKNTVVQVIKELRNNRVVFLECDEIKEWRPSRNESMLFLNKRVGVDKTINLIQRRTDATVIFGILHRLSLNRYQLILNDYEGILHALGRETYSVGVAILKYLERFIYAHPDAWYQWKAYEEIGRTHSVPGRKRASAQGISLTRPTLTGKGA